MNLVAWLQKFSSLITEIVNWVGGIIIFQLGRNYPKQYMVVAYEVELEGSNLLVWDYWKLSNNS